MKIVQSPQKHVNIVDNILHNTIEDIKYHLNPTYDGFDKYDMPDIFLKGVKMLKNHLDKNHKIGILMDDDVDGITSTALLYQFIKKNLQYNRNKIHILVGEGKVHGLTKKENERIIKEKFDLVILPDSGSNNHEEHKELNDHGIEVLVIDHHQYEPKENLDKTVIINNQVLDMNKHLTGVGMVYKFVEYYTLINKLNIEIDNYLDLVMLGSTADVADISDKELRYYVCKGIENVRNPFLKEVLKQKSLKEFATRDMSFSLISMVNSVCRIGTAKEKEALIKAFINEDDTTFELIVRSKNKKTGKMESNTHIVKRAEYIYDMARKIKSRQDRLVNQAIKEVNYINDNNIIIGTVSDKYPSSINGLIAMKISSTTGLPTMIGRELDGKYGGSARSPMDLNTFLTNTNLFDFIRGHNQAFGWSITKENMDTFITYLQEHSPLGEDEVEYRVDRLYTSIDQKPYLDVLDIEDNKNVFGGSVSWATLGFENVSFHKSCIRARGNMINLFDNDLPFVMFNAPDGLYEDLNNNLTKERVYVNIIGEPSMDWNNKPQIVIRDIQVIEAQEEEEFNAFGIDF